MIQARLLKLGVRIEAGQAVTNIDSGFVLAGCVFTERSREIAADAVVLVTARLPQEALYRTLLEVQSSWAAAGIKSVTTIGDALAPSTIAAAVHAGRRYAEEFEEPKAPDEVPFRREITELAEY